ncbi:MAG: hypothetical protein Q4C81_00320 [Kocuria sp.]|nr:hypothetical protein [Kocuria sp.]
MSDPLGKPPNPLVIGAVAAIVTAWAIDTLRSGLTATNTVAAVVIISLISGLWFLLRIRGRRHDQ